MLKILIEEIKQFDIGRIWGCYNPEFFKSASPWRQHNPPTCSSSHYCNDVTDGIITLLFLRNRLNCGHLPSSLNPILTVFANRK